MLDWPAMRIGFVKTLLWDRYGTFWWNLVRDAGAEPMRANVAAVRAALDDPRIEHIPALAFRMAAAEAIAMPDCELLVVPDLNPGRETGRGGGQDPWIVSFPAALETSVSGLPPVFGVGVDAPEAVESTALELLRMIYRDSAHVRRVWDRHRARSRPRRSGNVRWQLRPSETKTVGVVGQPWLLNDAVVARLGSATEHLVPQYALDSTTLREEGVRFDPKLVLTDAEAIGAARLFARRGLVKEIRVVVDTEVGSDAWLLRRIEDVVRKPLTVKPIREVEDPVGLLWPEAVPKGAQSEETRSEQTLPNEPLSDEDMSENG